MKKKEIYLDYAASTPMDPLVLKAMQPYFSDSFANPASLHTPGFKAKQALDEARSTIANLLGARSQEIIFTAGGTESLNLALLGVAQSAKHTKGKAHIITSKIEHQAVLEPLKKLETWGFDVTYLPVDKNGFVNANDLQKAVLKETILVSLMYANNEVGTIQKISEIGKWLRAKKILFHTDACQAAGLLDINVNSLNVDLLTLNGSKIYGPKQTGILYVKTGVRLSPIISGGGQEKGLRSGTENVAGSVGLARALELVQKNRIKEVKRLTVLRDYFIREVLANIPGSKLNGPTKDRLANNVNIQFHKIDSEALMYYLDARGIYVSTASACSTYDTSPSHVLLAMGLSESQTRNSVRFTLGKFTTLADIKITIKELKVVIKILK